MSETATTEFRRLLDERGVPARVVKNEPKRTYDEYARLLESGEWEVNDESDR